MGFTVDPLDSVKASFPAHRVEILSQRVFHAEMEAGIIYMPKTKLLFLGTKFYLECYHMEFLSCVSVSKHSKE